MNALTALVVTGGIAATIGQLLMLRELMTLLHGNEVILAVVLGAWLMLGGGGAWLGRRQVPEAASLRRVAVLAMVLALLLPAQLLAVRVLRGVLFAPGSALRLGAMVAFGVSSLAPAAALVGLFYPLALAAARRRDPGVSGARIYLLDAVGNTLGGALFSMVLVRTLQPLMTATLTGIALQACVLANARHTPPGGGYRRVTAVLVLALLCGLLVIAPRLEQASLAPASGQLLEVRETPYGRVSVVQDRGEITLFADGVPQLFGRDVQSAEERAHYPLAQVEGPQRVLLIGSVAGMLEEVAKHRPRVIEQVELNPALTELEQRYDLLRPVAGLLLLHADARRYLQRGAAPFDAILVNLPPPETFQLNRYYSSEFFGLCRRRLAPGGVLAVALPGFANYLSEEGRAALSMAAASARRHFPAVLALPGESVQLLCGSNTLGRDIPARLARRGIETVYISGQFDDDLSPERIAALQGLLDPAAAINSDERPRLVALMQGWWLARIEAAPMPLLAVLAAALALWWISARADSAVLFATGMAAMGWEMLLIFAFQLAHGYLYQAMGLIVTACLAGLPIGAEIGRRAARPAGQRHRLLACDLAVTGISLALLAGVWLSGGRLGLGFCLAGGFGLCLAAGIQFAVTLRVRGEGGGDASRLFGADLWGGACGALLGAVAIPWLGLRAAALGLALVKGVGLACLLWRANHATT